MTIGGNRAEQLEALDRAILEVDALSAIYGTIEMGDEYLPQDHQSNDDNCSCLFKIVSKDELTVARRIIENSGTTTNESIIGIPRLDVELTIRIDDTDGMDRSDASNKKMTARIQFGLPPGYPTFAPITVSVISIDGLTRADRDDVSAQLTLKAESLIGNEAMMDLIQELQDVVESKMKVSAALTCSTNDGGAKPKDETQDKMQTTSQSLSDCPFSRRWIWVHHIKDTSRRKDIVREARNLSLSGYLKPGYPGVVVIEGLNDACEEFVIWIKGNKSRPGGFGRNWGHHVRGQISLTERQLIDPFTELEEDLGQLSAHCKRYNIEYEFRVYILQHSG